MLLRIALLIVLTCSPALILASESESLVQALTEGGMVILMRHTQTETAEPAVSMRLSGDCREEQNLSAIGRQQAKRIAEAFKARGISVQQVVNSAFCRARDSALLAFGSSEDWSALNLSESLDQDELAFIMADVEERMSSFKGKGNLALVTHRSNINNLVFEQTEPGDMVVLQPDGSGPLKVMGILAVDSL